MTKKRRVAAAAAKTGVMAFSAMAVLSATTMEVSASAAAYNVDSQEDYGYSKRYINEYLQENYAFDLTILEEYLEEAVNEPASSAVLARSRSVVAAAPAASSGAIDYINANYNNLGIANVETTLNVRSVPVSGEVIGKLFPNGACEIVEEVDGWYKITSGDVSGYVSGKYLLTDDLAVERAEETIQLNVVVNVNGLNFRTRATTASKVMRVLPRNTIATVVEDNGDWVKISYNGQEGYVYGEHVIIQYNLPLAVTMEEYNASKKPSTSSIRTKLVEYAKQFVGNPYVYGGNSLTNGTDCSGFVKLIMAKFGITTPRTATTQYNAGKKISVAELLPGDLIVYGDSVIEHIGIYIGNGQIIHASNKKTGIKYSKYNYRNIYGCVRFIED